MSLTLSGRLHAGNPRERRRRVTAGAVCGWSHARYGTRGPEGGGVVRALVALPVRDNDYWHEHATVIHGDAEMMRRVEERYSFRLADICDVDSWDPLPEQPALMVATLRHRPAMRCWSTGHSVGAVCRALTADEWALVMAGRVEEIFS